MQVLKKARRKAVTLVELTLGLALAALVIFGAVRAYSMAQENNRTHQLVQEIGQVRAAVASKYEIGANYASLTSANIVPQMPVSLLDSSRSKIMDPFGGEVVVETAPTDSGSSGDPGAGQSCAQLCSGAPGPARGPCISACQAGRAHQQQPPASGSSLGKYVISPGGLAPRVCVKVASADYGIGQVGAQINGSSSVLPAPISIADATAACSQGQNTVSIGFR
ncbi:MAG: hypothetical protein KDJ40_10415 [Hyphomicrobiales bacterium]|nr:hypothetical protein [Hyphomicrobiales bacterium]HPG04070.1 hypothetical protein [Rhodoblastus sp.]